MIKVITGFTSMSIRLLLKTQIIEAIRSVYNMFWSIIIESKPFFKGKNLLINPIVMTNGKMVWKNGPCCWYFSLNILGWPYKKDIKAAKMVDSNDVLAFFVLMIMMQTLLRKLGRSLQMKKIITNAPWLLWFSA